MRSVRRVQRFPRPGTRLWPVPFLMAVLLVLLSGGPGLVATRVASAQPSLPGLCALLPEGFSTPSLPPGPAADGLVDACLATRVLDPATSYGLLFTIRQYQTTDQAHQDIATFAGTTRSDVQQAPSTRFGEEGVEGTYTQQAAADYGVTGYDQLAFRRGCYTVYGQNGAENAGAAAPVAMDPGLVQATAQAVDDQLKAMPPCAGAAAPAAPAAPALAAGLACDTASLQDTGQVLCTASVSNEAPGARIVYDWTFDGQAQPADTGDTLTLDQVAVGSHQVAVVARDVQNNLSAAPQSVSFTRAPAASSSGTPGAPAAPGAPGAPGLGAGNGPGPTPTGGHGVSPGLVVGGSALAIGTALGLLALLKHRRRARPAPAGAHPAPAPPAPPTPAAATVPVPPPVRRGRQDDPQVTLTVRLSPSVRTRDHYGEDDVHLWGDGVDLLFAEYDVQVSPPPWVLDEVEEDPAGTGQQHPFTARSITGPGTGGQEWVARAETHVPSMRYSFADGRTVFPHRLRDAGAAPAVGPVRPPHTQVVIKAGWSDQDHALTVWAALDVTVRNTTTGETRRIPRVASPPRTVQVVGARPRLELWADPDSQGCADGTSTIRVEPALFLFGQDAAGRDRLYSGGLELLGLPDKANVPGPDTPSEQNALRFTDYFEPTKDPVGPDRAGLRQGVTLRCRFHLRDTAIRKLETAPQGGYPLSFNARPTGYGLGQEATAGDFDWMASEHHKACRANIPQVPPERVQPVVLTLLPSTVRLDLDVVDLPRYDGPAKDLWRVRVSGTVRSFADRIVRGPDIRRDRPTGVGGVQAKVEHWYLARESRPPTVPKLRAWDPVPLDLPPVDVDDVDEQGRLTFAVPADEGEPDDPAGTTHPWYDYDHWRKGFDPATRYLRGQCTRVTFTLHTDLDEEDHRQVALWPPCKIYAYVDWGRSVFDSLDDLWDNLTWKPPDFTGHASVGLVDVRGKEIRAGLMPWAGLPEGPGYLNDDGEPVHEFHLCRAWDISHEEYCAARARMNEWKRESDLGNLIYGLLGTGAAPRTGNCVTFVVDLTAHADVVLPQLRGTDRPGNVDLAAAGRRVEHNPRYKGEFFPGHPWDYGPRTTPGLVHLDSELSHFEPEWKTGPPAPPLPPEPEPGGPHRPPPPDTNRPGPLRPKG
ncbi:hypothetical protein [Kitasatospora sp. NPDC005856]|uniref:hypothetical protein n=1 Tax=Kitasatospora sp. NPDC005856 TaxID=3154566 RepID=UPI0034052F73